MLCLFDRSLVMTIASSSSALLQQALTNVILSVRLRAGLIEDDYLFSIRFYLFRTI